MWIRFQETPKLINLMNIDTGTQVRLSADELWHIMPLPGEDGEDETLIHRFKTQKAAKEAFEKICQTISRDESLAQII